ncbi:MAG: indole-3-glycerol phosphate synthase TrpC [Elusimicrobia bacterium]|nr:indole-3-glycerol phosphate synthase TrpC [Elusimicrobiota bacterium]
MNILSEIVEYKKLEVEHAKKRLPLKNILSGIEKLSLPRDFTLAISKPDRLNLIAEIKKASPSAGEIVKNFNVKKIAKQYEESYVDAISVLTETKYFQGNISYINIVKQSSLLPVLRKDFIIDEYQIYESRYFNADAILLIMAILGEERVRYFLNIAKKLNLSVIVEIHTQEELKSALAVDAEIIGINNRNLADLSVDIGTTLKLKPKIPKNKVVVSESGIKKKEDIDMLKTIGVNAVLIGQHFMESQNITKSIAELFPVD